MICVADPFMDLIIDTILRPGIGNRRFPADTPCWRRNCARKFVAMTMASCSTISILDDKISYSTYKFEYTILISINHHNKFTKKNKTKKQRANIVILPQNMSV